jgi:sialate O-acetylesterase
MKRLGFFLFGLCASANAAVQLASPFTAHMVLQRDQPVPVWGTAEAGEEITVEFAAQKKTATADASGGWRVDLAPLAASSDRRILRVTGSKTPAPIALDDVLVGEVWLCSGQSNMVFTVSKSAYKWAGVTDEAQVIAAANYPLIRMFTGEAAKAYEPQARVKGEWRVCSPETVPAFSAIGYFFARDIQKELNVPVGIVALSFGASCAEAWIRREALAGDPKLRPMLEKFDAEVAAFRALPPLAEPNAGEQRSQDVSAAQSSKPKAPRDPVQDQHNSTVMFNGMIAPVIPYAIRGVLWYQGESIMGDEGRALYPRVQATLINDWRALWKQGDFPFYIVQLAGHDKPSNSPAVREAQATVLALKNAGMAVATDVGEAKNVHPRNKQAVADRLARIALANTYGRAIEFSGPRFESMSIEGGAVRLKFSHTAGGLVARDGVLKWFEVAGADGAFVAADATIEGESVLVRSANVPEPKAARYAWVNFPDGGHLYNTAGLPAAQFRTDAEAISHSR